MVALTTAGTVSTDDVFSSRSPSPTAELVSAIAARIAATLNQSKIIAMTVPFLTSGRDGVLASKHRVDDQAGERRGGDDYRLGHLLHLPDQNNGGEHQQYRGDIDD